VSGLVWLKPAAIKAFCESLKIVDTVGATTPWRLNHEQTTALAHLSSAGWTFLAKPRQVGMTTLVQADDVLWCWLNDRLQNRVRCGLYVDTDKKLKERQAFAESVIRQKPKMFAGVDINSDRVLFPGGSVLEFGTGSGKNEGRSGTFQRLHLSEVPFWQNPSTYGALMPAIRDRQCIVETTIDVDAPCGPLVKELWRGDNSYTKVFFRVEDHEHYQADPAAITETEWDYARQQGFTIRAAAAWWLRHALPDLAGGDGQRLMREYPQIQEHMFAADAGRYIKGTPEVIRPVRTINRDGFELLIYREPADCSGEYMIACDVAAGKKRDASAVAVLDKRDRVMVACLRDNEIEAPALARALKASRDEYTVRFEPIIKGADPPSPRVPTVVVEVQGLGHGVAQAAREIGVGVVEQDVSGAEGSSLIAEVLRRSKVAVASGVLAGPAELATECDELRRDPVTGKWKGSKDLLVAYGHADRWCDLEPMEPTKKPAPSHLVIRAEEYINAQKGPPSAWD